METFNFNVLNKDTNQEIITEENKDFFIKKLEKEYESFFKKWNNILKNMKKNDVIAIISTKLIYLTPKDMQKNIIELNKKSKKFNIIPKRNQNFFVLDLNDLPLEFNFKKDKIKTVFLFVKKLNDNNFNFSEHLNDIINYQNQNQSKNKLFKFNLIIKNKK